MVGSSEDAAIPLTCNSGVNGGCCMADVDVRLSPLISRLRFFRFDVTVDITCSSSTVGVIAAVVCAEVRLRFLLNLSMLKMLMYLLAANLNVTSLIFSFGTLTDGTASFSAWTTISNVADSRSDAAALLL